MSEPTRPCPCGCGAEFIQMVHEREIGLRADAHSNVRGQKLVASEHRLVYLLTGMPGAGKSTVARVLAERFDRAAHIDIDLVFHHFTVAGKVHPNDADRAEAGRQSLLAVTNAAALAANYFDDGYLVVLEGAVASWAEVEACGRVLASRPLCLVCLAPPLQESIRRDAERSGKHVADAYAYLHPRLHRELAGRGLWIDTAGWSIRETVDLLLTDARDRGVLDSSCWTE